MSLRDAPIPLVVEAARSGRQDAWAELLRRFNLYGFHLARKHLPTSKDAEDAVQSAWEQVWRHIQSGVEITRFESLFSTIVTRRSIDLLRRMRHQDRQVSLNWTMYKEGSRPTEQADFLEDVSAPSALEAALKAERYSELREALDRLPPHYRMVLLARAAGYSNRETARLAVAQGLITGQGDPEKQVENHWYRGLARLRELLRSEFVA